MNNEISSELKQNLPVLRKYMHSARVDEADRDLLTKAVKENDIVIVSTDGKRATLSWIPAEWERS